MERASTSSSNQEFSTAIQAKLSCEAASGRDVVEMITQRGPGQAKQIRLYLQ